MYGYFPDVSQVEIFKACQQLFELIQIEKAHQLFHKALKSISEIDVKDF